jgi:hypothetical protein
LKRLELRTHENPPIPSRRIRRLGLAVTHSPNRQDEITSRKEGQTGMAIST